LVNGKDAQDENPDPVGIGPQEFEVWFNKPMDPAFTPQVSFGVSIPYNQQAVADSGRWSPDYRKYTVYKTIELYTGDGINRIRVAAAKDTDGWEIPIEDERFEFNIQAAGSASTEFMAVAGIGKVYLEWNNTGIPDLLGFNLYRFNRINDTTHTLPVMINPALLLDTTFTDFNVTPGIAYYYFYRIVNTDFSESDSSNIVSAIPYTATPGDANGDLDVNVLDVTAVIAYMLNQDPQPFLFEAADVKDDNTINILDVIGIVDIILGKDKSFTIPGNNPKPACIAMEGEKITLNSDGQVAALQFELAGENTACLKLTTPLQGFELAYGTVNGKMLAILYNTRNMLIPAGLTEIVAMHYRTSDLSWGDAMGGDQGGNRVTILKNGPVTAGKNMVFRAFPNPFSETVSLSYTLETQATVLISVYDLHGKNVRKYDVPYNGTGDQVVEWNGCDEKGNQLPSGIYFARIEALAPDGTRITGNTKIVLVK
jgi:hypothetical protein